MMNITMSDLSNIYYEFWHALCQICVIIDSYAELLAWHKTPVMINNLDLIMFTWPFGLVFVWLIVPFNTFLGHIKTRTRKGSPGHPGNLAPTRQLIWTTVSVNGTMCPVKGRTHSYGSINQSHFMILLVL